MEDKRLKVKTRLRYIIWLALDCQNCFSTLPETFIDSVIKNSKKFDTFLY